MKIDLRKTFGVYKIERKLRQNALVKRIAKVLGEELKGEFMKNVSKVLDPDDVQLERIICLAEDHKTLNGMYTGPLTNVIFLKTMLEQMIAERKTK